MNWIKANKKQHISSAIWVLCIVEICNNETGEVREVETDEVLEDGADTPSTFNWESHNFSCDCNRATLFYGTDITDAEGCAYDFCSQGRFSVNLKNKKDGIVYYQEFERQPINKTP